MIALKTKISTPRLVETQAFYERLFGMRVLEAWDSPGDRGVILGFDDAIGGGSALLEIYFTEQAAGLDGLSLQFKVDDVAAFTEALPCDVAREGPKPRPWGASYLYLRDPAGVRVIVYEGCL